MTMQSTFECVCMYVLEPLARETKVPTHLVSSSCSAILKLSNVLFENVCFPECVGMQSIEYDGVLKAMVEQSVQHLHHNTNASVVTS